MVEDKELIQKVQSGDLTAFSELVDRHKNMVFSLVNGMVSQREDAEEVAQDSFVKAFKSIKQFRGDSKFSTWLYRIAYFTSLNHLRKKKPLTRELEITLIETDEKSPIESLNESDQKHYIKKALNYLKPIERNLISLYYLDEFSTKEIQDITDLTASNIKVSIMRIRKKLNVILKNMLRDELDSILKK